MTNSFGCFSTYRVAFADSLPYLQLFMQIERYFEGNFAQLNFA